VKKLPLTETIVDVIGHHPVAFAYLVGSQAGGKITPLSDVDVAVYFDRPPDKLTGLASGVSADLQAALGRPDVDVIELNRAGVPILSSIMKNARPLVIKNTGAETDFRRKTYQKIVDFQPTLELIGRRTVKNIKEGASS
jgi:predicted nucleotidyltransferase